MIVWFELPQIVLYLLPLTTLLTLGSKFCRHTPLQSQKLEPLVHLAIQESCNVSPGRKSSSQHSLVHHLFQDAPLSPAEHGARTENR